MRGFAKLLLVLLPFFAEAPGDVFAYNHGNGYVYNLGTQETWRTKAKLESYIPALQTDITLYNTVP